MRICFTLVAVYDTPAALQDQFMKVCRSPRVLCSKEICSLLGKYTLMLVHWAGYGSESGPVYVDVLALLVAERRAVFLRRLPHGPSPGPSVRPFRVMCSRNSGHLLYHQACSRPEN